MSDIEQVAVAVARKLVRGKVVPFLGAGVSYAGREGDAGWALGRPYPPSGAELARYLGTQWRQAAAGGEDLLRVAQYVASLEGPDTLYEELRDVFATPFRPTVVHEFVAGLPALMRRLGRPQPVIVTTNYDDLIEQALAAAGERFSVFWYEAKPKDPFLGHFLHRFSDEDRASVVEDPERWGTDVPAERRAPAVLKLHGAVNREAETADSYVITEDDYIRFMSAGDVYARVPSALLAAIRNGNLLYLGYGLSDWNLRVLVARLEGERSLTRRSWAVQRRVSDLERALWHERDVELLDCDISAFVAELAAAAEGEAEARAGR